MGTRTKFQLEILIRSTISAIHKFWEIFWLAHEALVNPPPPPRCLHSWCVSILRILTCSGISSRCAQSPPIRSASSSRTVARPTDTVTWTVMVPIPSSWWMTLESRFTASSISRSASRSNALYSIVQCGAVITRSILSQIFAEDTP